MIKLHSMNLGGNVHEAVHYINERLPEFAEGVIHLEFNGGYHSLVVFRADEALIEKAKKEKRL